MDQELSSHPKRERSNQRRVRLRMKPSSAHLIRKTLEKIQKDQTIRRKLGISDSKLLTDTLAAVVRDLGKEHRAADQPAAREADLPAEGEHHADPPGGCVRAGGDDPDRL